MSTKSTVLLEHHLKQLKLPTMLRDYASVAAGCTADRADYPTYLLRLTERELLDREKRAAERRLTTVAALVTGLLESREDRRLKRLLMQLERLDLLILD